MVDQKVYEILVVDDELDIANILAVIIEGEGPYRVHTANSGLEGIRILEKNKNIYAVFSDNRMRGGSGVELCQWVRQNRDIHFTLVTSDEVQYLKGLENFLDDSKNHYLEKPFDVESITKILRKTPSLFTAHIVARLL